MRRFDRRLLSFSICCKALTPSPVEPAARHAIVTRFTDLNDVYNHGRLMMNNAAFWNGKRVFITGHTGFKGGWLTLWLQRLGADVAGYALTPPTEPNLFTLADIDSAARTFIGDVRNLEQVQQAMAAHQPEIVLHLAAQPIVRRSYADPVETFTTNVVGTVNLLEAARHANSVKAVVVVTSDKCYENNEWPWGYRETEAMGGRDPYSSSKGCAELVTAAYRHSYFSAKGVPVASVRAGNVIGGGDWAADRLIPDMIKTFLNGHPVNVRNPQAIRPWQHVLDPLCGYLEIAQRLYEHGMEYADAWNFGPGEDDAKSVGWMADAVARMWGDGASWVADGGLHPHEATFLRLDSTKARTKLGWTTRLPVRAALEWTVEWYKAFQRGGNMRAVTLAQLERYEYLGHQAVIQPLRRSSDVAARRRSSFADRPASVEPIRRHAKTD